MDVSLSKFQELVMNREARRTAVHGVAKGNQVRSGENNSEIHLPDSKGLRVFVEIKKQGSPRYAEHGEG